MRIAAAAIALLATVAHSTTATAGTINYGFTYKDTFGVLAWGSLTSSSVPSDIPGNPSGAGYLVTGGSITVATPASASPYNVADGTYPLQTISPPPSVQTVEGDNVDNLAYPGNNAGAGSFAGISSPSYIDTNGLVFGFPIGDPSNHNPEVQVGVFSLGNNNYALGWTPTGSSSDFFGPTFLNGFAGGGTFTLLVLPEPSSLMLLGLAGVLGVGYGLRRRRSA